MIRAVILSIAGTLVVVGIVIAIVFPFVTQSPDPSPIPSPIPSPVPSPTPIALKTDDRQCVGVWPAAGPPLGPNLLPPTIEERVSGIRDVTVVRLNSVSYDLPDPARNNRIDLGEVDIEVTVLENLKGGDRRLFPTIGGSMEVGYDCEYRENDQRDLKKLAELSVHVEGFLADKTLIVLGPQGSGFWLRRDVASFQYPTIGPNLYRSPLLLIQAEGVGTEVDPHFYLHWEAGSQGSISLSDLRTRIRSLVAEEREKGFECVSASYEHQWYVRSGEERWYRGKLTADGKPIECLAAGP